MIREPRVDDLEKLVDLSIAHCKDSGQAGHDDIDRAYLKKQIKQMMIAEHMQPIVVEQGGRLVGYAVGAIKEKLWNGKRYGELLFLFLLPEIRNKMLIDDMVSTLETWFLENNCFFMQASVMAYNKHYEQNEDYVEACSNYFEKRQMNEVGYHFVKEIGSSEWAA